MGEESGTSMVVMLYTWRQKILEPEKPTTNPVIWKKKIKHLLLRKFFIKNG